MSDSPLTDLERAGDGIRIDHHVLALYQTLQLCRPCHDQPKNDGDGGEDNFKKGMKFVVKKTTPVTQGQQVS